MGNPPIDLTHNDGGQRAARITLTLTFDLETLHILVSGPLANRTLTYMILAGAQNALDAFYSGQPGAEPTRIQVAQSIVGGN